MTDEVLCKKLKEGKRTALNEAITRFTPYVSAVAWRVMSSSGASREDLEEVVADTFIILWKHASEIDPALIRPWLAKVAKNKAVDRLRKITLNMCISEDEIDRNIGPEEKVIQQDRYAKLWDAVNSLEEPDRTLFVRHYYGNEKLMDIAKDLGIGISAVKTRLHRGRKLLKKLLIEGEGGL